MQSIFVYMRGRLFYLLCGSLCHSKGSDERRKRASALDMTTTTAAAAAAAAAGGLWQRALVHLQETSFGVGCVPSARQWLDFFSSCTHPYAAGSAGASSTRLVSPLPWQVSSLIAETLLDAARLARLQQLLSSPLGVLGDSHIGGKIGDQRTGSDNTGSSVSGGNDLPFPEMPQDLEGLFLTPNPDGDAASESDMVRLLGLWCASHETPHEMEQLASWLRNVTECLRFFTLCEAPHSCQSLLQLQRRRQRLYLVYTETLCVLHHALCTMFLRPSQSEESVIEMDVSSAEMQQEAALLALWLLRASNGDILGSFTGMLQNTQRLLASCEWTQAWLLLLPAFLRGDKGGSGRSRCVDGVGVCLSDMQKRSPICQLARELLPGRLTAASPNVLVPFVDASAIRDADAVYAVDKQLSRIASGTDEH